MAERVHAEGRPVLYYVHPREIDPGQPRLAMSPIRGFKSYVNLRGTEAKLRRLLSEFRFTSLRGWLQSSGVPALVDEGATNADTSEASP